MKTQRTTLALTGAGFVAALLAMANTGAAPDGLIGFGAVAILVAVAALDYGFGRRRLLTK